MITTKNSDIMQKFLETLIKVSSKKTSNSYSMMILNSLIGNLSLKYEFLKGIKIKITSFSSSSKDISIIKDIDGVAPEKIGAAINDILNSIIKPLGDSKESFLKELKGYLGQEYELKLKNIGVLL